MKGSDVYVYRQPPWGDERFASDDIAVIREVRAPRSADPLTTVPVTKQSIEAVSNILTFRLQLTQQALYQRSPAQDRRQIWGLCQLAVTNAVKEEILFRASGTGECFTLMPSPRSSVPLQWVHIGPYAIPDRIADMQCADSAIVLHQLNLIMGTAHTFEIDGLRSFIERAISVSRDFGEVYGRVRPWWHVTPEHPAEIYTEAEQRLEADDEMRLQASGMSSDDGSSSSKYIHDATIPPRRVWDLFSNRVLPYSVFPRLTWNRDGFGKNMVHGDLWTVSHSWAAPGDRVEVHTEINGRQWPVPIPHGTSLEHVRVELLNMGAQYVWLDILCLRQRGRDEDEPTRKEEWKIDVPTIGQIYRGDPVDIRRCITYFNGLGLPFTTDPATLRSERHWFNRAWTLQETLETWLPGGLTGLPQPNEREFFDRVFHLSTPTTQGFLKWLTERGSFDSKLLLDMKARSSTSERDQVAGMAYCLQCKKAPIYTEEIPVESAWHMLLEQLDPLPLTNIFLLYTSDLPFSPVVSFSAFLAQTPIMPAIVQPLALEPTLDAIDHEKDRKGGLLLPDVRIIGPCHLVRKAESSDLSSELLALEVRIDSDGKDTVLSLTPCMVNGVFLADVPYDLVTIDDFRYSIVAESVSRKDSYDWFETIRMIKWGVIYAGGGDISRMMKLSQRDRGLSAMLIESEEARERSQHTERYMQAFKKMREKGSAYTFGDDM